MAKQKRKIYKINLWLYSEEVKVDIMEFTIKRRGTESISTIEGEVLYLYDYNAPSDGIILGDNCIHVSMLTEDFLSIDKEIEKMIEVGRKRVDMEIAYLQEMHKQLDTLNKYENRVFFNTRGSGWYYVEKDAKGIKLRSWNKEKGAVAADDYINKT